MYHNIFSLISVEFFEVDIVTWYWLELVVFQYKVNKKNRYTTNLEITEREKQALILIINSSLEKMYLALDKRIATSRIIIVFTIFNLVAVQCLYNGNEEWP